jgi:hypothetical protein
MKTKTWKPGLHNVTLKTIRSEIKRLAGEIGRPDGDPMVISEMIVKMGRLIDERDRREAR